MDLGVFMEAGVGLGAFCEEILYVKGLEVYRGVKCKGAIRHYFTIRLTLLVYKTTCVAPPHRCSSLFPQAQSLST